MGSLGLSVDRRPSRGLMGAALTMEAGSCSRLKSRFHREGVVGGAVVQYVSVRIIAGLCLSYLAE